MKFNSKNKNKLIERYVTYQMSFEEESAFEAFFLPRQDWIKAISTAAELFDECLLYSLVEHLLTCDECC